MALVRHVVARDHGLESTGTEVTTSGGEINDGRSAGLRPVAAAAFAAGARSAPPVAFVVLAGVSGSAGSHGVEEAPSPGPLALRYAKQAIDAGAGCRFARSCGVRTECQP